VAIRAIVGTDDVLDSFGTGLHARAGRVTANTCHRCALEYAINMALFTFNLTMLTIELKARCQVVKWHCGAVGCRSRGCLCYGLRLGLALGMCRNADKHGDDDQM